MTCIEDLYEQRYANLFALGPFGSFLLDKWLIFSPAHCAQRTFIQQIFFQTEIRLTKLLVSKLFI